MPRLNQFQCRVADLSLSGPPLIIAGLAALIFVVAIPHVPALAALSILTLGATNATLGGFRNSPVIVYALLLHVVTYASLYALFVGATLHAAAASHGGGMGVLQAADLATSVAIMTVSLRRIAVALRRRFEPQR